MFLLSSVTEVEGIAKHRCPMSNRFPPLAAQVKARAIALPDLPWFELTFSLALLILLHQQ